MKDQNHSEGLEYSGSRDAGTGTSRSFPYHPTVARRRGRLLLGRYRLESLLGIGAMGEVYQATDLQLAQPCAVKLVFPGAVLSLQAHRRFANEVQLIARLFHPNIVQVRDFNESSGDGVKFLVMELLEGNDLHEVLTREGSLPLARVLEIMRGVGSALQYAHDLGIMHRDVKPNNIFLTRSRGTAGEGIKVLDFGLAKLLGEAGAKPLTQGIIVGTPAYMSPEATASHQGGGVDARTDQWSLAVVAYQLLSGRMPFVHANPYNLCQMICSEAPPSLQTLVPGLPEHVYRALDVALAKRPQDRFPTVSDFVRSLDNLPPLSARAHKVSQKDLLPPLPLLPQVKSPPELPAAERSAPRLPGVTLRVPLFASIRHSGTGEPEAGPLKPPRPSAEPAQAAAPTVEPAVSEPPLQPTSQTTASGPALPRTVQFSAQELSALCRLSVVSEDGAPDEPAGEQTTVPYRTMPASLLELAGGKPLAAEPSEPVPVPLPVPPPPPVSVAAPVPESPLPPVLPPAALPVLASPVLTPIVFPESGKFRLLRRRAFLAAMAVISLLGLLLGAVSGRRSANPGIRQFLVPRLWRSDFTSHPPPPHLAAARGFPFEHASGSEASR